MAGRAHRSRELTALMAGSEEQRSEQLPGLGSSQHGFSGKNNSFYQRCQAGLPRAGGLNAHCIMIEQCNRNMEQTKAILGTAVGVLSKGKGKKGGKGGKGRKGGKGKF